MRKSCSRLRLEQLLRIFRALQTSQVLHISMNARWRMNQLLIKLLKHNIPLLSLYWIVWTLLPGIAAWGI